MSEEAVSVSAETLAQQRAMPVPRLLDCGMDYADAISLFRRTTAGAPWEDVAEDLAAGQFARADRALAAGHLVTAQEAQSAGIAALIFAQMAFNFDVPRKLSLYRQIRAAGETLASIYEPTL